MTGRSERTVPSVASNVSLEEIPLHSTNLLTLLDEEGIIQYESPAIERILGFRQNELIGEPMTQYFHPEDREQVLEAHRSIVDSESFTVESVEYRHEQADGSYCWVESVGSSNPTPAGYYVINSRDITASKERQQQLVRTNDRLDEFASVISHDLRNPLNVASGQLTLAKEEHESEHLDAVEEAIDRMDTLVENLLTLARRGEDIGATQQVTLKRIAERSWANVETGEASLVIDDTDLVIPADPSRLQQLLENLIRNAVEHGSPGITITLGDLNGGFYIEDDGPGIHPGASEAIFDASYTTSDGASGFGLSIVRAIAEAHGWDIRVDESDAGGVRFEITDVDTNSRVG